MGRVFQPVHVRLAQTIKPRPVVAPFEFAITMVIPGIVKNGVVVPQTDTQLPDGARVDIVLGPAEVTPELQAEFDQWEKASDEAWAMIDEWEKTGG